MTLDEALNELYAAPLDAFTTTRDRLAGQLATAGDKKAAAALKKHHKPTRAAHALNTLARVADEELEALFRSSRLLATGKDFKAALERQRAALNDVQNKVSGSDARDVMGVVRGAMVDEALAGRVREGRFSKIPEVQLGFFGAAPEGVTLPKAYEPSSAKEHRGHSAPSEHQGGLARPHRIEPHGSARPNAGKQAGDASARAKSEQRKAEQARAAQAKAERLEAEHAKAEQRKAERARAAEAARLARAVHAAETELKRLTAAADQAEKHAAEARERVEQAASELRVLKQEVAAVWSSRR